MWRPGGAEVAVAHSLPLPVRKFRCLARVTAFQPQDVTQMCHRSEDARQAGGSGATCCRTVCTMHSSILISAWALPLRTLICVIYLVHNSAHVGTSQIKRSAKGRSVHARSSTAQRRGSTRPLLHMPCSSAVSKGPFVMRMGQAAAGCTRQS